MLIILRVSDATSGVRHRIIICSSVDTQSIAIGQRFVPVAIAEHFPNLNTIARENAGENPRFQSLALGARQTRQDRRRRDQVPTTPFSVDAPLLDYVQFIAKL